MRGRLQPLGERSQISQQVQTWRLLPATFGVSGLKEPNIGLLLLPITVAELVYKCHHDKCHRLGGFNKEIIFPTVLEVEVQGAIKISFF